MRAMGDAVQAEKRGSDKSLSPYTDPVQVATDFRMPLIMKELLTTFGDVNAPPSFRTTRRASNDYAIKASSFSLSALTTVFAICINHEPRYLLKPQNSSDPPAPITRVACYDVRRPSNNAFHEIVQPPAFSRVILAISYDSFVPMQ
ncbi:uncharacterized protein LOC143358071 [Halictus rubicundus]|uniref:uncharacterized protein LOC143358071 n=1 Tax=Halictus rubicundus TaxID=77578 RepID=UPI004037341C